MAQTLPLDAWDGILQPGETVLWQGQPDGRVRFESRDLPKMIFGLLFAGFALFWMIMASAADGVFWMFGLLHFGVGLSLAAWPTYGVALTNRRTWYTLTNQRAFIATDLPWRRKRLQSYPITADTPLEFEDDSPGSIWFGARYPTGRRGNGKTRAGFERIHDARSVYRHFMNIQRTDRG